ncbi:MAG: hypothetical protein FJX80_11080 [Bacteroidetes bacterium]|nr:hypothetical protein [Bacteroidota bacterium]
MENEQEQQKTDQQVRDSIMQNDVSSSDDITIVNEEDLVFVGRTKKPKVKLYFDGGTYLTNYPHHRDGWTKVDWDFYASLVRMKVARNTRKNKLTVLDDIKEFRMIPTKEANELCQYLYDNDLLFVVYEGDEIRRKSLGN